MCSRRARNKERVKHREGYSFRVIIYTCFLLYFDIIFRRILIVGKTYLEHFNMACNGLHARKRLNEDWRTVKLPVDLIEIIDDFVKTNQAKRMGIFSRTEFLTRLITAWFSNYIEEFQLFMPRNLANKVNEISSIVAKHSEQRSSNTEPEKKPKSKQYLTSSVMSSVLTVIGVLVVGMYIANPAMHHFVTINDANIIHSMIPHYKDYSLLDTSDSNTNNDVHPIFRHAHVA